MRIVVCGSITASEKLIQIAKKLESLGFEVELPYTTKKIMNGEITLEDYCSTKEKNGDNCFREQASEDLIKQYYQEICKSDAILVVNIAKQGIKNYVGGNALMEIAFAYVLGKKIYLLNGIPTMGYSDEIIAMKPIVINGDLAKIK